MLVVNFVNMKYFFTLCLTVYGFLQLSEASIGVQEMPLRVDLCVLIDTSGYFGRENLNIAIEFMTHFLNHVSVSPSTTRIALTTSGSDVKVHFNFRTHVNRECTLKALEKVRHNQGGKLSKASAMMTALRIFRKHGHPSAKRMMFHFTGGKLREKPRYLNERLDPYRLLRDYENDWSSSLRFQSQRLKSDFFGKEEARSKHSTKKLRQAGVYIFTFLLGRHSRQYGNRIFNLRDESQISKVIAQLPFTKKSFTKCESNGEVYDECNRRCICINGKLEKCTRIRKEFTEMSKEERQRFVRTFKALTTEPVYKNRFEKYSGIHKNYFQTGIHSVNFFFPWHRWYMWKFENIQREVDCRNTLPYWDWIHWSDRAWNTSTGIWKSDDEDGLGGNGNRDKGYCVQTGPFRGGHYRTMSYDNPKLVQEATKNVADHNSETEMTIDNSRCIRRCFNDKPDGPKTLRKLLKFKPNNFTDFEQYVRVDYHNRMHNRIGGHMCTTLASLTPEFYLHHAFIDKIWHKWQQKSSRCKNARFKGMRTKMTKYACPHTQEDFIDSRNMPGCIRVEYSNFANKNFKNRPKANYGPDEDEDTFEKLAEEEDQVENKDVLDEEESNPEQSFGDIELQHGSLF